MVLMEFASIRDTEDSESRLLNLLRRERDGESSRISQADCRSASLLFAGEYFEQVLQSFYVGETFCIATMATSGEKDLVVITGLSLTVYKKVALRMTVTVTASTPWEYRSLPGDSTPPEKGASWSAHLRSSILRYLASKTGKKIPSRLYKRLQVEES